MAHLIVGVAQNGVIGQGPGIIPWRYPEDLKWFKKTTMDGVLILGRHTFDSLGGRKLIGREIIVLSQSADTLPNKVTSMADALYLAGTRWPSKQIWIAGGAQVYAEALRLKLVSRIYLTAIPETPPIDVDTVCMPQNFLEGFDLAETMLNENDDRLVHQVYRCSQQ